MRFLKWLFTRIYSPRASRPEDIPQKLSAEALAAALGEAKYLHSRHGVDVTPLAPGELPKLPRRADL